jgi:hypothetical protein
MSNIFPLTLEEIFAFVDKKTATKKGFHSGYFKLKLEFIPAAND